MNLKVGDRILEWLSLVGDPNRDPWHDSEDSSLLYKTPLGKDPVIIDPTFDFRDISDELDEVESDEDHSSGSSSGEEGLKLGFTYRGRRDSQGLFHGGGTVSFENGDELLCDFDHGSRRGNGVVVSPRNGISRVCGVYEDGVLQGRGKVVRFYFDEI